MVEVVLTTNKKLRQTPIVRVVANVVANAVADNVVADNAKESGIASKLFNAAFVQEGSVQVRCHQFNPARRSLQQWSACGYVADVSTGVTCKWA